ncbi:UV radiation resistance protein and autophagy-related subunit 14-domain-containing protein [Mycena crocata]|nr:UV radiation resistance protein and autophagy-related subunit 14-domain-containing protein [Mycena crocata]
MECKNCELKQRQLFCTKCIRIHRRDFRLKTHHFAAERDEQVARSTKSHEWVEATRLCWAGVSQIQARVDEVLKRDRLRILRELHAERRTALSAATAVASPTNQNNASALAALANLSVHTARARAGLVQELIDVFHVVQVGGRPPVGGKAGSQGEWTIGDLILPVPGDVRCYPPQHINAVLGHAYLGVKLPFGVRWEGGKLGVGVQWIGPGRGGWGRHPLHLSLSSSPTPASPDLSLSQSLADSTATLRGHPSSLPYTNPNTPQFTTALAMLLYDVVYLAHTQGLQIALAQAGDVLRNLWAVCCAAERGRRVHATSSASSSSAPNASNKSSLDSAYMYVSPLPAPASGGFGVEFAHVVQAAASGGGRRAGLTVTRHVAVGVVSESREAEGAGGRVRGGGEGRESGEKQREWQRDKKSGRDKKKNKGETEDEDDDGWDLVSEDGY